MSQRIVISAGDFNGIGPEVVLKSLQSTNLEDVTPIILSSSEVIDYYLDLYGMQMIYNQVNVFDEIEDGVINVLESYNDIPVSVDPGGFTKQSGTCAMLAVEKGIDLCKKQQADALVTAPISKEAVNRAGYNIPGHTEFLADSTGTENFMMMLVHDNLRVGLVTGHVPVTKVKEQLSSSEISRFINIMQKTLQKDFGITNPHIAVLGLNPHAGDGGIIGDEEQKIISPALKKAQKKGINVSGPHPADGYFGNRKYETSDAILAMYHDQGLIPFKTLSFGKGVNFTAGLPIIRTSPDHGTAFDIAGKNKADSSSFSEAFMLAIKLAKNRKKQMIS